MEQAQTEYKNKSPYKLGQFGDQLESMTAQQVFNIGVEHLLLQNKKSLVVDYGQETDICAYDGDGVCCAAAPFIKNYNEGMEYQSWIDIAHTEKYLALISKFQEIHDSKLTTVKDWPEALKKMAERFQLQIPQILADQLIGIEV